MASGAKNALDKIGIVCTVIVVFFILKFIVKFLYNNILATALGINAVDLKKTGKWAVVTGASDGIGKAFTEALAKKNLNIVLISRTQSKLDDVAENIRSKYKVETKTISVDFTDANIYDNINEQLRGLDIGVLINNVGLFYLHPEYFLDVKNKKEVYSNVINCNILSVTNMCQIILPGMIERKCGVIVNVSSMSATCPQPLLTVYAATKSYIVKFSDDLQAEYKKDRIIVQCLVPGYVVTNMSKIDSPTWIAPAPSKYVKSALATVGVQQLTTGYFPHTLLLQTINFFDSVSRSFTRWLIIKEMLKMKTRALSVSKNS